MKTELKEKKIKAIDARMIECSGIGTYIRLLMGQGIYDVALGSEALIRKYDKEVDIIEFEAKIYGIKEQIVFPYQELKKRNVTILHCPHYNIPLFWKKKLVVTIHDVIHLRFPQYLPNKMAYIYANVMMRLACLKAKRIFTVSENTKKDIIQMLNADSDKIIVTYNAVEECFQKKNRSEVIYLCEKYPRLSAKKVILYVGNLKTHKNVETLVQAFCVLCENWEAILVLVGKDFKSTYVLESIEALGIGEKVILTGTISQEELVDMYNLADVFVFPSLYEGFGIPPLEAMACGTPVICSNTSSLPEVVGDVANLVNPLDAEAMREAIEEELRMGKTDENPRIAMGYRRTKMFSSEKMANKTKDNLQ